MTAPLPGSFQEYQINKLALFVLLGVGNDLRLVGLRHFLIADEIHGEGATALGHGPEVDGVGAHLSP